MKGFALHRVIMKKPKSAVPCVQSGVFGAIGEPVAVPLVTKAIGKVPNPFVGAPGLLCGAGARKSVS